MPEAVEHYVQGRNAWRTGLRGLLPRRRAFWATVLLTVATMGTPWWWTLSPVPQKLEFTTKVFVPVAAVVIGSLLASLLYLYRKYVLRQAKYGWRLHSLAHYLRDAETKILSTGSPSLRASLKPDSDGLSTFVVGCCDRVRDIFRDLAGDPTIEAAIRIAVSSRGADGAVVYRTIARSSGLSPARNATTEDVPANAGVARFFLERTKSQGVLLYRDIAEAARKNAYMLSRNDDLFRQEISTMMVAPLNAWNGHEHCMIGLLYVTSSRNSTFTDDHVEHLSFAADTVAAALSEVVEFLDPAVRQPTGGVEDGSAA